MAEDMKTDAAKIISAHLPLRKCHHMPSEVLIPPLKLSNYEDTWVYTCACPYVSFPFWQLLLCSFTVQILCISWTCASVIEATTVETICSTHKLEKLSTISLRSLSCTTGSSTRRGCTWGMTMTFSVWPSIQWRTTWPLGRYIFPLCWRPSQRDRGFNFEFNLHNRNSRNTW